MAFGEFSVDENFHKSPYGRAARGTLQNAMFGLPLQSGRIMLQRSPKEREPEQYVNLPYATELMQIYSQRTRDVAAIRFGDLDDRRKRIHQDGGLPTASKPGKADMEVAKPKGRSY